MTNTKAHLASHLFRNRQRLLSLVLLTGCTLLATDLFAAEQPAPVVVERIGVAQVSKTLTLAGTVTPAKQARLSTSVSGLAEELMVVEGSQVERGDIVLRLDDELAHLALRQARAEQRRHQLLVEDAQRRLEEAESLVAQKSISASVLKDISSELAAQKSALASANAAVGIERATLARHTLKAPFDGVISQKLVERGEWVNPGQGVFQLVANRDLRLDFALPQDYFASVQKGTPLTFYPASAPDAQFQARVSTVVPVASANSRTFLLRVMLDTQNSATVGLTPGMAVTAELTLGGGGNGLSVPRDAIQHHTDGRSVVWTVHSIDDPTANAPKTKESVMVARQNIVTVGSTSKGYVEVLSGLSTGALVVIRGNEALRQDQRVVVIDK